MFGGERENIHVQTLCEFGPRHLTLTPPLQWTASTSSLPLEQTPVPVSYVLYESLNNLYLWQKPLFRETCCTYVWTYVINFVTQSESVSSTCFLMNHRAKTGSTPLSLSLTKWCDTSVCGSHVNIHHSVNWFTESQCFGTSYEIGSTL